ncbi:50S ribosomal protein L10 [Candidatus Peregrinibacteria bacterium CG22_combo_CG10-13_8_21_14_all_44_10]|nr:MAG: 50S ribosomal protein L10 [Candidatus Peregrinibacteria bacterium CG2_30_44_17]PIP66728.1 MAG: 50S ribosomal protein L10 [Candidatus Peregrinibacteria bacterium CG22_combo_CG10-13_8_21_14_all_44_10]PIS04063.1 MAG: 50S ribosomal protein L10 [Candidatus Peregrinibacteria bacterium CG10_big_fil_rev_8_21_14_0_10_44_7]PIX79113.1 MAG: 50S ribosomal protein L10 [Candidatus Peregrinibacteria bacterium CG_4_10_14_3_um_filter_44_21]PJB88911.1 MAG: 50S ribosomal protein L10 [Candidatus Peregriniba
MAVTRHKKLEILTDLKEKFKCAKSVVFTTYSGLSVKDLSKVRSALRANNVQCKVAKKTLINIAAQDNGYNEVPSEIMEGAIAAIFSDDEVTGAKTIATLSKEFNALKLLGGLMDGEVLSISQVEALSKMPSKEELLVKLLGSMKSPMSGLANSLAGVTRKLVYVLEAHRSKLAETES